MKYFIGLDAHSSTSTFAVLDQEGQCILRKTVDTSEKNLWNVIESIQGERVLTFEESTISQWLYISLREKVDRLLVCNPTYVAKKSGAKTDFETLFIWPMNFAAIILRKFITMILYGFNSELQ